MKKTYKAYLLKNYGFPVGIFWLKRDAIAQAKKNTFGSYEWNELNPIK